MRFARHWSRARAEARTPDGETFEVTGLGWSTSSPEEAARRAAESARRTASRVAAGEHPARDYGYSDRPVREEVVEEVGGAGGEAAAAVTRNSYGALVLNTKDLVFIDIDLPQESSGGGLIGGLKGLFGKETESADSRIRKKVAAVAGAHPELTVRLYRTFAGFRCALTNRRLAPGSPESTRLLEEFDADPLYVRLCQAQQSYRARLTPKYWRCGVRRPPNRFPWDTAADEREYREWEREYEAACAPYATCRFVEQSGAHAADAETSALIAMHDRLTKAEAGLELA